jgi:hypothetical protein
VDTPSARRIAWSASVSPGADFWLRRVAEGELEEL